MTFSLKVHSISFNNLLQKETGSFYDSNTPVTLDNLSGVVQLTGGANFICALLSDNSVKCWGLNKSYQLGIEEIDKSLVPVAHPAF